MSLSTLLIYTCALLASICYAKREYLNANEPERKSFCSEEFCEFICLPTHCGNELILTQKKGTWPVDQEIEVVCKFKYSCGGQITIDGKPSPAAKQAKKATIRCDENPKESCFGGQYVITELHTGTIAGDTRESNILFKKLGTGAIVVKKGKKSPPEQFFMNKVWTQEVNHMFIFTEIDRSIIGSYFDLTGLMTPTPHHKVTTWIDCRGSGSCAGSIFVFKKCGGTTKLECGPGACQYMTLMVLDEKCDSTTNPSHKHPSISVITHKASKKMIAGTGPIIFVVCPAKYLAMCVKHDAKGSAKYGGPAPIFDPHDDNNKWLAHAELLMKALMVDYGKLTVVQPDQWIREGNNLGYFSGVMFEAALGSMTVGVVGGLSGAAIIAAIGGTAFGVAASAAMWPLAIPGVILVGLGGVVLIRRRQKKRRYKMPTDFKAFKAHQDIENRYESEEDQEEENQVDVVDDVVEYVMLKPGEQFDLLTGKIWHKSQKSRVNMDRVDNYDYNYGLLSHSHHSHAPSYAYDNTLFGTYAILSVALVGVCCLLMMLVCVAGGFCGFHLKRLYQPTYSPHKPAKQQMQV